MSKIQQSDGIFYISLWKQPANLKTILDMSLDYIWIVNHYPVLQTNRWWKCRTQIKENGDAREILVREMNYDILITLGDFICFYEDFPKDCITLLQLDRPVPSSLTYYSINENKRQKILQENGVRFAIDFPISNDIGMIWSTSRSYLEGVIENECVRELIRDNPGY